MYLRAWNRLAKQRHGSNCTCDCFFCFTGRCKSGEHPSTSIDKLKYYMLCCPNLVPSVGIDNLPNSVHKWVVLYLRSFCLIESLIPFWKYVYLRFTCLDGDCEECKKKTIMFLNCPLEMDNNHLIEYEVFKKVNSLREHHDDTYINYADEEQTTNGKKFTIRKKIKKNLTGLSKR